MTHKNLYTGLTYAENPTIMAHETSNELYGPTWGDMIYPQSGCKRSLVTSTSLGQKKKLVVDGIYGVNKTHLSIPKIEIFSVHFYALNNTKLQANIDLVRS